jgi:small redox-active disulfide protein 2
LTVGLAGSPALRKEVYRMEVKTMEIKILGIGCANCKRVESVARQVVEEMGVEATITEETDMAKIVSYDIVTTPGLVINEKVVSSGRIPSKAEVTSWVANALAEQK